MKTGSLIAFISLAVVMFSVTIYASEPEISGGLIVNGGTYQYVYGGVSFPGELRTPRCGCDTGPSNECNTMNYTDADWGEFCYDQVTSGGTVSYIFERLAFGGEVFNVDLAGDVYLPVQGSGVILRATNGSNCYRLTVDNSGTLTTTYVNCP